MQIRAMRRRRKQTKFADEFIRMDAKFIFIGFVFSQRSFKIQGNDERIKIHRRTDGWMAQMHTMHSQGNGHRLKFGH